MGFNQAAPSGLFLHSADGGHTWDFAVGAPGGYVTSLRFDPRQPGTVYGLAKGPVRSRDGGATWLSLAAGLPQISAVFSSGLALDPASGAPYLTANLITGLDAQPTTFSFALSVTSVKVPSPLLW